MSGLPVGRLAADMPPFCRRQAADAQPVGGRQAGKEQGVAAGRQENGHRLPHVSCCSLVVSLGSLPRGEMICQESSTLQ